MSCHLGAIKAREFENIQWLKFLNTYLDWQSGIQMSLDRVADLMWSHLRDSLFRSLAVGCG